MNQFKNFPYRITLHAEKVITNRKIKLEWILQVLENPRKTEPDVKDNKLKHVLGKIPQFGDRVLRIIYNETTEPWTIITVYFDRNQKNKI